MACYLHAAEVTINVGSLSAVSYAFTYSGMPLTINEKVVTHFTFTHAYK